MAKMPDLYHAVVRPIVTEKSSEAFRTQQEYAFMVDPEATKPQIKEAIERLFDVRVKKVRTAQQRKKDTWTRIHRRFPKVLQCNLREK